MRNVLRLNHTCPRLRRTAKKKSDKCLVAKKEKNEMKFHRK